MQLKNTHCKICNIEISSKNYYRQFKTKKHVQNEELNILEINKFKSWARENDIYNYINSTLKELKNIKINFNEEDYNIFNNQKLNKIGKDLCQKF